MEKIKRHFEQEAHEFDEIVRRNIPYYEQMVDALVAALPFDRNGEIHVIDLGCGTGTIAKRIKDNYPRARLTCVDIAGEMLRVAESKLGTGKDVRYQLANFEVYEFDATYDAVVSSLALHHLITDNDKIVFYRKIFECLSPDGLFYNADVVLGSSPRLQEHYIAKWREFMLRQIPAEEIEHKWLPKYYDEDRPAVLIDQLHWLREIGFAQIDVLWKYYNFAVYGGRKPSIPGPTRKNK
jgi:tRNA (cmo5U34)-methyltransferase